MHVGTPGRRPPAALARRGVAAAAAGLLLLLGTAGATGAPAGTRQATRPAPATPAFSGSMPTATQVAALAAARSRPRTGAAPLPTVPASPAAPSRRSGREDVATQVRTEHCQSRGPRVWLTFDDGGSAHQVRRILAVLRAAHVQAIFFPIGSWTRAHPGLVREIGRDGHLVGDHTFSHVDLARAGDATARWQIVHGEAHGPGAAPLLRPPFGAGAYTDRVHDLAEQAGLSLCTWTVDTRDWTGRSAAHIVRAVAHGDAVTPPVHRGGVVIMHMNGEHTGAALPGVIRAVRARHLALHRLP